MIIIPTSTIDIIDLDSFISTVLPLISALPWIIMQHQTILLSDSLETQELFIVNNKQTISLQQATLNTDTKFKLTRIYRNVKGYIFEHPLQITNLIDPLSKTHIAYLIELKPIHLENPLFLNSQLLPQIQDQAIQKHIAIINSLSRREREVIYFLSQGMHAKEITKTLNELLDLDLSAGYIGNLIRKVFVRFNVYNHVGLMSIISRLPQTYAISKELFNAKLSKDE